MELWGQERRIFQAVRSTYTKVKKYETRGTSRISWRPPKALLGRQYLFTEEKPLSALILLPLAACSPPCPLVAKHSTMARIQALDSCQVWIQHWLLSMWVILTSHFAVSYLKNGANDSYHIGLPWNFYKISKSPSALFVTEQRLKKWQVSFLLYFLGYQCKICLSQKAFQDSPI